MGALPTLLAAVVPHLTGSIHPLLGVHKGGLIPLTAPDALSASGNSAQAIRPMGGRKACVSVVRFTAPIVAVTAFISNTKNENSYAIEKRASAFGQSVMASSTPPPRRENS